MSDEISAAPAPWKVADQYAMRDARDIRDANGALVAVGVSSADARLIVDAVNEHDRLRDIVRRLADNIERYHLVGERDRALIREARAASGRDEK